MVGGILPFEFLPVGILSVEYLPAGLLPTWNFARRKLAHRNFARRKLGHRKFTRTFEKEIYPPEFCNTGILHMEICLLEFYLMEFCPPNTWKKLNEKGKKKVEGLAVARTHDPSNHRMHCFDGALAN